MSNRCIHERRKNRCRECYPDSKYFCVHKRIKEQCRECHGSKICEHDRLRHQCKICLGSSICKHIRIRATCILCDHGAAYKRKMREAKQRALSFSITEEQFVYLSHLHCFYCGESEEQQRGIDRWDSDQGYEFKNCRPCCAVCNRAKSVMSGPEFINWLTRVASYVSGFTRR